METKLHGELRRNPPVSYRKRPKATIPESNVIKLWSLINPESSDLPESNEPSESNQPTQSPPHRKQSGESYRTVA